MTNTMFPVQRKVSVCTSCGARTMCISEDGGVNWACNRCKVIGVGRGKFYDDQKLDVNTVAPEPTYGYAKEETTVSEEKTEEEQTQDVKPKTKKRTKKKA